MSWLDLPDRVRFGGGGPTVEVDAVGPPQLSLYRQAKPLRQRPGPHKSSDSNPIGTPSVAFAPPVPVAQALPDPQPLRTAPTASPVSQPRRTHRTVARPTGRDGTAEAAPLSL